MGKAGGAMAQRPVYIKTTKCPFSIVFPVENPSDARPFRHSHRHCPPSPKRPSASLTGRRFFIFLNYYLPELFI